MKAGRIKRQYVWEKTGGFCWYCGARLYLREDADTELKKRLVFTVDHMHPRVHGGRGRANKVPACKYCNSHKSWRSVEQFREWVRTRPSGQAKNTVPRGWRINAEGVIFYFELASWAEPRCKARELRSHPTKLRTTSFFIEPPSGRKWPNSKRNMVPAELHAIERIADVREKVHAICQQKAAWRDDKASPYNLVSHPEHKDYVEAMSHLYQAESGPGPQPENEK